MRWRFLSVVPVIALAKPWACAPGPGPSPPDVLLVTIDTLRGDRLGCLGDPAVRTPELDRLARGAALAYEGRAPAPVTLPSHVSMMTGLPPVSHGVRDNGIFRLGRQTGHTVAERFRAAGYTTAAFIGAYPVMASFGLDRGFDHYDQRLGREEDRFVFMRERPAELTVRRLRRWFDSERAPSPDGPVFLWVHFFDPHADYRPPEPWRQLYDLDPYRGEVAHTDRQVGRVLAELAQRRPGRRLRSVCASDHGEGLGDHGETSHGFLLRTSTIRVPIIARTEEYEPELIRDPVSLERVSATLLSLAGLDPRVNAESAPPLSAPPTPVLSETLYPWFNFSWRGLRAWEENGWRLVVGERDRLFRLEEDPGEERDLASSHPEILARMKERLLQEWEERRRSSFASQERNLSPTDVRALRSLGYVGGDPGEAGKSPEQAFHSGPDPADRVHLLRDFDHAVTLLDTGEVARAIESLERIVGDDPKNRFVWDYLGQAHLAREDFAGAQRAFRAALELGPNPTSVYLGLADAEGGLGNEKKQENVLRRALAHDTRSVAVRLKLAALLADRNREDEALRLLREAVELRPRSAAAHAGLARVHDRLGARDQAVHHWREVLELDADGPLEELAREALARREG